MNIYVVTATALLKNSCRAPAVRSFAKSVRAVMWKNNFRFLPLLLLPQTRLPAKLPTVVLPPADALVMANAAVINLRGA